MSCRSLFFGWSLVLATFGLVGPSLHTSQGNLFAGGNGPTAAIKSPDGKIQIAVQPDGSVIATVSGKQIWTQTLVGDKMPRGKSYQAAFTSLDLGLGYR